MTADPWIHAFSCPVYGVDITLIVAHPNAFRRWLEEEHPDFDRAAVRPAMAKTIEIVDGTTCVSQWLVWFPTWRGTRDDVLLLVHESGHLVHQIFRAVGLYIDRRHSEEAFTYLQSTLVRDLWSALTNYRRGHGKATKR